MAINYSISFADIPFWCAATKVSGLNSLTVKGLTNAELVTAAFDANGAAACLCASVNEKETEVIAWLEKNKWTPGPWVKNHNHGGRKTAMYFKQVSKARYERDEL